jgi:hypothetical protein
MAQEQLPGSQMYPDLASSAMRWQVPELVKECGSSDGLGFSWHVWIDLGLNKSYTLFLIFLMFLQCNRAINALLINAQQGWLNNVCSMYFVNVSWLPIG